MKHKTLLVVAAAAAVVPLSGCDSVNNFMNERSETVEYYRIYDIKTDAKIKPVADAALKGLTYTTTPKVTRHIPKWKTLPDEPGRFETADMFNSNSNLARLMASSGAQSKIATCDGAVWTAVADRGSSSDGAKLFACLWPYKGGYHLDMFATFTKLSGGGLAEISRQAAYAMVGTPEQWVEKMLLDAPREIRNQTGAEITIVEAYPEVGETTWLDQGTAIEDKSQNSKF